jgi:hypothetical protein
MTTTKKSKALNFHYYSSKLFSASLFNVGFLLRYYEVLTSDINMQRRHRSGVVGLRVRCGTYLGTKRKHE